MDGGITDTARSTMLRAAVVTVDRGALKAALEGTSFTGAQLPTAVANAINALRKHRDPSAVVGSTPYRAALPYVAAAVADPCLDRTIEVLGDHSDDPTRDQLEAALAEVGNEFPVTTVAVMLASVAAAGMPASDLCFEVLDSDERFGLTGWSETVTAPAPSRPATGPKPAGPTPEQREERRLKKQRDADERRRKQETARLAGERVRQARKKERAQGAAGPERAPGPAVGSGAGTAPRLTRRAVLTPVQEEVFDRDDPWAAGVVYAWVPFGALDPGDADRDSDDRAPGGAPDDGKVRPCVVVAGSPTHLLVRPGYSDGGVKSRDWKSVPVRHWRRSGFGQPTWIDIEMLAVERDVVQAPVAWLAPDDWNALW